MVEELDTEVADGLGSKISGSLALGESCEIVESPAVW